jgi:hypothetical protein
VESPPSTVQRRRSRDSDSRTSLGATVERWFLDFREQGIKEKALGQTMKRTLEGYDICAEGMNYDYEREFRMTGEGFEKVMVRVGENDEVVG